MYETLDSSRGEAEGKEPVLPAPPPTAQPSPNARKRSRTRRLRAAPEQRRARAARGPPHERRPLGAAPCPGHLLHSRGKEPRDATRAPRRHRTQLPPPPPAAPPPSLCRGHGARPPARAKPPLRGLSRPSPLRSAPPPGPAAAPPEASGARDAAPAEPRRPGRCRGRSAAALTARAGPRRRQRRPGSERRGGSTSAV